MRTLLIPDYLLSLVAKRCSTASSCFAMVLRVQNAQQLPCTGLPGCGLCHWQGLATSANGSSPSVGSCPRVGVHTHTHTQLQLKDTVSYTLNYPPELALTHQAFTIFKIHLYSCSISVSRGGDDNLNEFSRKVH